MNPIRSKNQHFYLRIRGCHWHFLLMMCINRIFGASEWISFVAPFLNSWPYANQCCWLKLWSSRTIHNIFNYEALQLFFTIYGDVDGIHNSRSPFINSLCLCFDHSVLGEEGRLPLFSSSILLYSSSAKSMYLFSRLDFYQFCGNNVQTCTQFKLSSCWLLRIYSSKVHVKYYLAR